MNNQSILWLLLKVCYNRIRESWRTGGYPPTDFPSSRISVELRTPEALQLLAALEPQTRRHNFLDHRDNINWCALALTTYRDFTAAGHKPTIELLDKLLACLRLPFTPQAATENVTAAAGAAGAASAVAAGGLGSGVGSGSGMPQEHAQEQQFLRELQREQANVEGALVGLYEVPFDKRALDLVSEAINQGLLPPLKVRTGVWDWAGGNTIKQLVVEVYGCVALSEAHARGTLDIILSNHHSSYLGPGLRLSQH